MLQMVVLLAGVISSMIIGWFVVMRDPRKRLNQLYGLLTLGFISLTVFNHLTLDPSPSMLSYIRMVVVSTTVSSALMLLLALEIFSNARAKRYPKWVAPVVLTVTAAVALLELTPAVFSRISDINTNPSPEPSWGIGFFIAHFAVMIASTVAILFWASQSVHRKERQQLKFMRIGLIPILLLAPLTSVVLPVFFGITLFIVFSPLYLVFFLAMVGYAIVKHGLFDIRLATVRTLAYALSLLTLAGIYGVVAFSLSQFVLDYDLSAAHSAINIAMVLVLVFVFQPIKRFFDKATNRIFYKDQYDTSEFIAGFNEVLTSTTDLRSLLQRAAIEIGTVLKAEQAYFFVEYADTKHISAGVKGKNALSVSDFDQIKSLVANDKTEIFVTELMPRTHALHTILARKDIAILMPLRHKNLTLGYLALGAQLSSGYTNRDLSVLRTVSDSLLIAIQNSLSVQEIREINAHLKQKVDEATKELRFSNSQLKKLDATKDEFISMASHQLRTPLTAVKGFISMVLDGDIGDITPEQRKVLEQAFESSQRMVFLISDFLNVSRIQTGKFMLEQTDLNIASLNPEEIDQLVDTARSRKVELKYEGASDLPLVSIDENKVRQVMMNFMDNAIYYSRPNTTIFVRLYRDGGHVVFKVVDSGIGVPKSEQPHLFTKFYRASNARRQRPDGTGIGLYMAKKVILAHGGTIIFDTIEGKGSTFGFRLPLKDKLK